MIKRNFNVPQLDGVLENEIVSDLMVEKFVKTFIPDAWIDQFKTFAQDTVDINSKSIQDWLNIQYTLLSGRYPVSNRIGTLN